jgi:signal transduction histidine kinase
MPDTVPSFDSAPVPVNSGLPQALASVADIQVGVAAEDFPMAGAATDRQEVLRRAAEQALVSDGPLREILESAIRLVRELDKENRELRKGVFHLDDDPAVSVTDLFSSSPATGDSGEDAQQEVNAFLLHEHVLQKLADGITVQDRDLNIVYQNEAMRRAFGKHVGEKCYAVYEKRTAPCEGCGIEKAFRTGEPTLVLRTAFEADGTTSFWENACFPIFDGNRTVMAGVEVCRNVSTRVSLEQEVKDRNIQLGQLNEELKRQAARLEEALHLREQAEEELRREMDRRQQMELQLRHAQKLRAIGQLAAGIAHEINTPAQFVADNLGFLRDSFNDLLTVLAKYRQALASLAASSNQELAAAVIAEAEESADVAFLEKNLPLAFADSLDGLSRISAIVKAMSEFGGPGHSEKTSADLNRALQDTLLVAQNEYRSVADVETQFAALPLVPCHLGDLNQVFLNLLVNAAHAVADVASKTGKRGCIRLRTAQEASAVRIEIEDTGSGIAPEIQDRLFEPFFTTKGVGQGSGQGLATAYSIVVDKHQGSLTFQTEVGKGTTFTILLPTESR